MSVVQKESLATLDHLTSQLKLETQTRTPLYSAMAADPVGEHHILKNDSGFKAVYIGLTVPMIKLDSHMIFCFSPKQSVLPHYTLDAVDTGEHYAFHLDLIPRCDLGVNLEYMKEFYQPLDPVLAEAKSLAGLSAAHLSPTQLAVMSPWMMAFRANQDAIAKLPQLNKAYLDHWLTKASQPPEGTFVSGLQNTEQRDRLHREILFHPRVDPVWKNVTRLLGEESSEKLRTSLLT